MYRVLSFWKKSKMWISAGFFASWFNSSCSSLLWISNYVGITLNTQNFFSFLVWKYPPRRRCVGYNINSLHWRHNDHDGVSNHQPHGCLLNRLFRRRSKKTSKDRVTDLCAGNSPGPVNSRHKGPVTRKMFPFDDVIMYSASSTMRIMT